MTYRVRNIGIAIALAVVAALLTSFYVANYKRNVQHGQKLVNVYVASGDIASGLPGSDVLDKHLLKTESVVRRNVVPGAISSPDQIKQLVALQPTYAGEQVSARRFGPLTERGIRAQITGTERAVQIPGDASQLLAGTLKAGDHVDVLAAWTWPEDSQHHVSRVILRDLNVLRASAPATKTGKLTSAVGQNLSVQLAVTDAQAQKLFWAMRNGEWTLQLRPPRKDADSPQGYETSTSLLVDGISSERLRKELNDLNKLGGGKSR